MGKKGLVKNRFAGAVFTMHLSHLASLAFALLVLGGCLQQQELPYFEPVERAEVERVIDGDTIVLKSGERVRLIGIDAPEKGENCSEEAKNRLQQLVLGKSVLLGKDVSERGKYGRLVRFVYADGLFVNLALIEEGFALAFEFEPDTSFSELFREAELKAVGSNSCLWKMKQ